MLGSIFAKAIRDRAVAVAMATGALTLFLLFAMAVYRDLDLSIYTDLPQALRDLAGIPEGADAASLAYNVMFGTIASLTLAGMALSFGAAAIAGEERGGTISLLLANPKSRRHVLVSKAAAMVALVATASLALCAGGIAVPAGLGVEVGDTQVAAMALHLGVNALFYGFLALAVGGWTGNRALASGATAATMVVSFVAVGLLPLVDAVAGGVKAIPWYYFDASDPLVNGVAWGHLAVLVAGAAAFLALAVVGLDRRDLRGRAGGRTVLDRLRANPITRNVVDRLAGSARVSRIWVKVASEHQGILAITAGLMFSVMGVLMGPMYTFIDDSLADFGQDLPDTLLALVGQGDISTPQGWFQIETFGLMAPIAVILVTVVIGARALAGEESRRTMGLLLANPVSRARVVVESIVAMVVFAVVVGGATFAGTALGAVLAGLDVSVANLAATSALVTLLGLVFGALALALGAVTGRVPVALYGAAGAALALYLLNAFLPLNDSLAGWAKLSPFYYYLSADPLNSGMPWGHAAVLLALAVAIMAVAVPAFSRRDLRAGH